MEQESRIFRQVEEDEVLMRLRRNPVAYRRYQNLEEHWRAPGYITAACSAIPDWS